MKIIAVGDPHFRVDNIPEVNMFVERLISLCDTEKPDLIVVLGDVLHTHERLHTVPLNLAIDFIEKVSKISKTIVLVGNHDYVSNTQFLTTSNWMSSSLKHIPNVEVADKVLKKVIKGFTFYFCPYVPNGRFQEALLTLDDKWKDADCIFAHQEFAGCKMGAIISCDGDPWPLDYSKIVSGHIHSKQRPQENIYYCGSSMQVAFGESQDNIIPIFKFAKNKDYELNEIDLGLPRKKIVYTDIDSIDDVKINNADSVKLSITGNYEEFKAFKKTKKYKELVKTGAKVVFKQKKLKKQEGDDVENDKSDRSVNDKKDFETVEETQFLNILTDLIMAEKNSYLYQAFEYVINNKNVDDGDGDIMFL